MNSYNKSLLAVGLATMLAACGGNHPAGNWEDNTGGSTPFDLNNQNNALAVAEYIVTVEELSDAIAQSGVNSGAGQSSSSMAPPRHVSALAPRPRAAEPFDCSNSGGVTSTTSGDTTTYAYDECMQGAGTINGQYSVTFDSTGSNTGTGSAEFGTGSTPLLEAIPATSSSSAESIGFLGGVDFELTTTDLDAELQGFQFQVSDGSVNFDLTIGASASNPLSIDQGDLNSGSDASSFTFNGPFTITLTGSGSGCPSGGATISTSTPITSDADGDTLGGVIKVTSGSQTETITYNTDGSYGVSVNGGASTSYTVQQLEAACNILGATE